MKLRSEGAIRLINGLFIDSRKKEINGLITKRVFKIVSKYNILLYTRIFGYRFVNNIK